MDINGFLDTITDKSVLVQAFRTSPEDAFIHVFNVTGNLLEPYTNSITIQLEKYIPSSFVALKFPAHINSLPFMNPVHVVMSMVGYLLMIAIGTTVMRGFSKFEAKTLAFYHNTFLTLLNAYMMIGIAEEAVKNNFQLLGNGIDESPAGWRLAKLMWLFYISKVFEFIDTVSISLFQAA